MKIGGKSVDYLKLATRPIMLDDVFEENDPREVPTDRLRNEFLHRMVVKTEGSFVSLLVYGNPLLTSDVFITRPLLCERTASANQIAGKWSDCSFGRQIHSVAVPAELFCPF
ncbi:hypothetical protein TNCV_1589481 [Trichonephila clavipes]|uniref:Uncharacterized protein n=1 Tax=Trichonephila clavipes TaxID=2585209 RepID=A0A8X6RJK3_TRICX|nr:hypothetical protein TNCV_1589481 [Trichonephila clavipes]